MNSSGSHARRRGWRLWSLVIGASIIVTSAEAKVLPMTVSRMTQQASWIVEGRVTDVHSAWSDDRTQIYTFATVTCDEFYKGTYSEATFQLRLLGGTADGISMIIPEGPLFSEGERVILFLGSNPQAFFPIVGLSHGAFKVTTDPSTGHEQATNGQGLSLAKAALIKDVRAAAR